MSAQGRKLLHRELWSLVATGLMLATPCLAANPADTAGNNPPNPKHATVQTQPKHEQNTAANSSKVSHPAPAKTISSKSTKPGDKAASKITPQTSPRQLIRPAFDAVTTSGPIRRVAQAQGGAGAGGFDHALLDDGTFWREQGSDVTWQQTGMASWYGGPRWQGKQTTSGERYDQNKLTAAHATLPIGTKVRVVRTDGRGSVIVTINDRPGSRTRIIDLSRAAAKELGILTAGVTMVTLQPL